MLSEWYSICSIKPFEFGYYERPDGGCVDEYKIVARFWDRENLFLHERIIGYEDSPGEAVQRIADVLENGCTFVQSEENFVFPGGYKIYHQEGNYYPLLLESYIDRQVEKLCRTGEVTDKADIIPKIKARYISILEEDDYFSDLPYFGEEQNQNGYCTLTIAWDF
ncbi:MULTISPECIES: hypothetical protein [Bacillota]|uniref:hypothetical protein n=1 Tax=Bacillota TaxID=1239 RepID=UPI0039EF95D7